MILVKEFNSETWADFVSLMQTDPQCSDCWCLNHRRPPGCATGSKAQLEMQKLTKESKAHGLLAYDEQKCIGWIAIDPIAELVGHDCQASGKTKEWSIHCLFVRDGYRGQGVSQQLIKAAVDYAKSNGASLISAFPIPEENRKKFPINEAEFSGRFSTYTKLGFVPDGVGSDFYQRVELK